jgi:hypothetical protein
MPQLRLLPLRPSECNPDKSLVTKKSQVRSASHPNELPKYVLHAKEIERKSGGIMNTFRRIKRAADLMERSVPQFIKAAITEKVEGCEDDMTLGPNGELLGDERDLEEPITG